MTDKSDEQLLNDAVENGLLEEVAAAIEASAPKTREVVVPTEKPSQKRHLKYLKRQVKLARGTNKLRKPKRDSDKEKAKRKKAKKSRRRNR